MKWYKSCTFSTIDLKGALDELAKLSKEGNAFHCNSLLRLTYKERRKFIENMDISISDIINKYPYMGKADIVIFKFFDFIC